MEEYSKTINGYLVEVEIDHSIDPPTQGWVSKGSCSSSLGCLLDTGSMTSSCGSKEYPVADSILDRIEGWAMGVGY
jgi:hypothetical protein